MRCYVRALLLCTACAFFSALYVFNQLASSLEAPGLRDHSPGTGHRTGLRDTGLRDTGLRDTGLRDTGLRDTGLAPRRAGGEAGQHVRELPGAAARSRSRSRAGEQMHLAVVACGSRLEETVTMLKSAVLFSSTPLHFHIFAEDHLHGGFRDALRSWPSVVQSRFNYTTYPITFPAQNPAEWKKLFKPCASQRLFLPLILKEVDSLLYVDTDILFLQPVEEIWSLLRLFSSTHIAAMAPEHEEPRIAWYSRFARHPYYGKTGVNSGVMLMNMSRIRGKHFKNDMTPVLLKWEELLMPLLQKYKLNITWGDQDLLNIIFHHNPESLYVFPCQWNYRPDHCIYGSNCHQAEQEGVFILHGNRGVYHDDKQPAFRAVYEAIQKFPFGENMAESLLRPLEAKLQTTTHTYCGRASHLFTKRLQQTIDTIQQGSTQARGTV